MNREQYENSITEDSVYTVCVWCLKCDNPSLLHKLTADKIHIKICINSSSFEGEKRKKDVGIKVGNIFKNLCKVKISPIARQNVKKKSLLSVY